MNACLLNPALQDARSPLPNPPPEGEGITPEVLMLFNQEVAS